MCVHVCVCVCEYVSFRFRELLFYLLNIFSFIPYVDNLIHYLVFVYCSQLLPQSLAYRTLSDRLMTVSSLQMHIGFSESRINNNNNNYNKYNYNNDYHNNNNNNDNDNYNVSCNNDSIANNDNNFDKNSTNTDQDRSKNNEMISKINDSIKHNMNHSKKNHINNYDNRNYGNNTGHTGRQTQETVKASRLSSYYDGLLLRFESVQEKHVTFKLTSLSQKKYRPSNFGNTVTKAEDAGDHGSATGISNSEEN